MKPAKTFTLAYEDAGLICCVLIQEALDANRTALHLLTHQAPDRALIDHFADRASRLQSLAEKIQGWPMPPLPSTVDPEPPPVVQAPGQEQDQQNHQDDPNGRPPVGAERSAPGVAPKTTDRGQNQQDDQQGKKAHNGRT